MIELPIYFINQRRRYGYKFTEMFSELIPIEAEAPLEPVKYSTQIMLEFLDISIRGYPSEPYTFQHMTVNFANRFGPLKSNESTYLEDFKILASSINTVTNLGRQEIQNRTRLTPEFSLRVIDWQAKSGDFETAVELDSLIDTIWFDFLINGTNGYRQCEYINIFNERRKNCSAWISLSRSDQKWCSDACRMSAKRKMSKTV